MPQIINKKAIRKKKLLVICPTRQRPQKLGKLLETFKAKTSENTGLLVCLDDDDPNLVEYQKLLGYQTAYIIQPRKNITQIFNHVVNELCPDYEFYSPTNDDFEYLTKEWDNELIGRIAREGGWGIAYGDDRGSPARVKEAARFPTTSVISGNIVRALG